VTTSDNLRAVELANALRVLNPRMRLVPVRRLAWTASTADARAGRRLAGITASASASSSPVRYASPHPSAGSQLYLRARVATVAGGARFVDIHSHVVPSGGDGVRSVDEGRLSADAFAHETVCFTRQPMSRRSSAPERGARGADRKAFAKLATGAVELRLGFG